MSRLRSRWLALFGGVTLIALSLSTAFAGKPDGTNPGLQVSAYVHSLVGDVEETDEQADEETETEDEIEDEVEDETAASDHGTCVAEVAQDKEAVGPPNDNHGGAVSEAARVTCREDATTEETETEDSSEDEGDAEVESDEDGDTEVEESDEADASESGSEHGEGHGQGHGGDSSED